MGLSPSMIRLIIKSHRRKAFEEPVLTLGNQDTLASYDDLRRWFTQANCPFQEVEPRPHTSDWIRKTMPEVGRDFVHARTFFEMMGINEYADLDLLEMDAPQIVHDLNAPIPARLNEHFGLVLDSGTLEHIFDVRRAIENTARLCRRGGRVIHISPALNYLDHSFYSFHPTLFFNFYHANGFEETECYLFQPNRKTHFDQCPFFEYRPGMDAGALLDENRFCYIFFTATKVRSVDDFVVPMQGFYAQYDAPQEAAGNATQLDWATRVRRFVGPLFPPRIRKAIARSRLQHI